MVGNQCEAWRFDSSNGSATDSREGIHLPLSVEIEMPRYFFHRTNGYVDHDTDGVELRDLADARLHAIIFAGETLKEDPDRVWAGQELHVAVTDASGAHLFSVKIECIPAITKTEAP